jgi:hypothetical protein
MNRYWGKGSESKYTLFTGWMTELLGVKGEQVLIPSSGLLEALWGKSCLKKLQLQHRHAIFGQ